MGTVISAYAIQSEFLNYRNGWVVCHIPEFTITCNVLTGLILKEPPKPRLMTTEEIESDHEPNEDDRDYENK